MSTLVSIFTSFIDALYSLTNAINFPSYALAIIILGLIVRLILLPLTIMQMKSMLGMTEIQPELQRLQKQYVNNREKLSEEMMKLYQEYNVKPAAGCLPILIQLPILYILFWAIRDYNFADSAHANFFWISSLNNTDPTYILPIVLGISHEYQPTGHGPFQPNEHDHEDDALRHATHHGLLRHPDA